MRSNLMACFSLIVSPFLMGALHSDFNPVEESQLQKERLLLGFAPVNRLSISSDKQLNYEASESTLPLLTPEQIEKKQQALRQYLKKIQEEQISFEKKNLIELCDLAGDYSLIVGLLGNEISEEEGRQIAFLRDSIHQEIIEEMVKGKAVGERLGIFYQLPAPSAATPLFFTLYTDNQELTGKKLVAVYFDTFEKISLKYASTPLKPFEMGIYPRRYESTLSDWRQSAISADFSIAIAKHQSGFPYLLTSRYINENSAEELPVSKLTWYETGQEDEIRINEDAAPLERAFFYYPEASLLFAWGSSLKNWHLYHASFGDLRSQAKTLLESIDNGVGLNLGKQKTASFALLAPNEQKRIAQLLYGSDFPAEEILRIVATLQTASKIVNLPSNADLDQEDLLFDVYQPLMTLEKNKNRAVSPSEQETFKLAENTFHKEALIILAENNLLTSKNRFSNWILLPLKNNEALVGVDKEGKEELFTIDEDRLNRLRNAAFFEMYHLLPLTSQTMSEELIFTNPDFKNEIKTLLDIFQKKKEMFFAPEELSLDESMNFRFTKAEEVQSGYKQLEENFSKQSYALRFWHAKDSHALSLLDFSNWLFQNMAESALSKPLKANSEVLFEYLKGAQNHSPLLTPLWLTRINTLQKLIEVLTTLVQENQVDQKVLWNALSAGLDFIPGIQTLYSVEGSLLNEERIALVNPIKGYGTITFYFVITPEGALLVDLHTFVPIVDPIVRSAYEGELALDDSPELLPPLLYPIDHHSKLSLNDRRQLFYEFVHNKISEEMHTDLSVWYEEQEQPREWQTREFNYLSKYLKEYLEDWWQGKGLFESFTAISTPPGAEIQMNLIEQLSQDYVTGKNIQLEKEIIEMQKREQELLQQYYAIANEDTLLHIESNNFSSEYTEAAELSLAFVLDRMPTLPASIEISAAQSFASNPVDPDLPLSRKLYMNSFLQGSLKEHPAPWQIEWNLQSPEKQSTHFNAPQEKTMEATAGIFLLTARGVDGNGKEIAKTTFSVPIEEGFFGENDSLQPTEQIALLYSYVNQITLMARQANSFSKEINALCKKQVYEQSAFGEQIQMSLQALDSLEIETNDLAAHLNEVNSKAKQVPDLEKTVQRATDKVRVIKSSADEYAYSICSTVADINLEPSQEGREDLLKKVQKTKLDLIELHKQARDQLILAQPAYRLIATLHENSEDFAQKIEKYRFQIDQLNQKMLVLENALERGSNLIEEVATKKESLKYILEKAAKLKERIEKITDQIRDPAEEIPELQTEFDNQYTQIQSALSNTKDCSKELEKIIEKSSFKQKEFYHNVTGLFSKIDLLWTSLLDTSLSVNLEDSAQNSEANLFMIELWWGLIVERLQESEQCEKKGKERVLALTRFSMPEVVGLPVGLATDQLVNLKLKVNRLGGSPAPSEEMAYKIQSQKPSPGTELKPGDEVTITIYGQYVPAIPEFTGKSVEEANKLLSALQIRVDFIGGGSAPSEELSYKIAAQSIPAGLPISSKTALTLKVYSEYRSFKQVPSVVGLKQDEAIAILAENNFSAVLRFQGHAKDPMNGYLILSQEPLAGTELISGSAIRLNALAMPKHFLADAMTLSGSESALKLPDEEIQLILYKAGHTLFYTDEINWQQETP